MAITLKTKSGAVVKAAEIDDEPEEVSALVPEQKSSKGEKESDKVMQALQKQHGASVVAKAGNFPVVRRIPTGFFPLDFATGGGFPVRKSTIIFGPESSGKTLVLYKIIAEVQKEGKTAVLVDVEYSHDDGWAAMLGVDVKKLIVVHPDNAEQAIDAVEAFLHADDVGIVGLDSIAMMVTSNELTKGAEVAAVGGASALVGKLYRKVGSGLTKQGKAKNDTMFVAINQTRFKIGVMYGNPETMPGGQLPKFASALTVRIYGKKEIVKAVNPDAPALLHVSGVIQKYKVPIVGTVFEYDMALIPHDGLGLCEVDSWNTVSNRMAALGGVKKMSNGYLCMGDMYKTISAIKEKYVSNDKFKREAQKFVIKNTPLIGVPTKAQK